MANTAERRPAHRESLRSTEKPTLPEHAEVRNDGGVEVIAGLKGYKEGKEKRKAIPEDVKLKDSEHGLYAVFDGVSTARGDVASSIAAETTQRYLGEYLDRMIEQTRAEGGDVDELVKATIQESIREADRLIKEQSKKDKLGDSSTTASVTRVVGNKLYVANVGDSRVHLFRDGKLEQLTKDDGELQKKVDKGELTQKQLDIIDNALTDGEWKQALTELAEKDPSHPLPDLKKIDFELNNPHLSIKNVITEAVGGRGEKTNNVPVDVYNLQPGDRILVASDGLEPFRLQDLEKALSKGKNLSDAQLESTIQSRADYLSSSAHKGAKAREMLKKKLKKEFGENEVERKKKLVEKFGEKVAEDLEKGKHPRAKPDDIAAVITTFEGDPSSTETQEIEAVKRENEPKEESPFAGLSVEKARKRREVYLEQLDEHAKKKQQSQTQLNKLEIQRQELSQRFYNEEVKRKADELRSDVSTQDKIMQARYVEDLKKDLETLAKQMQEKTVEIAAEAEQEASYRYWIKRVDAEALHPVKPEEVKEANDAVPPKLQLGERVQLGGREYQVMDYLADRLSYKVNLVTEGGNVATQEIPRTDIEELSERQRNILEPIQQTLEYQVDMRQAEKDWDKAQKALKKAEEDLREWNENEKKQAAQETIEKVTSGGPKAEAFSVKDIETYRRRAAVRDRVKAKVEERQEVDLAEEKPVEEQKPDKPKKKKGFLRRWFGG